MGIRKPDELLRHSVGVYFQNDSINTLDIFLTIGKEYHADYTHPQRKNSVLSFGEIHISQAQVSRLEKGALEHIRKQI